MKTYKAEITAYYPSNEGVEGGYYDALGKPLDPDTNTCACPKEIPFHTKLKIEETGTKYDGRVYECLDRGSAIVVDSNGVYHIDLLMHDKEEANTFGRRKNATITIVEDEDFEPFLVKVICDKMDIVDSNGKKVDELHKGDVYTIIDVDEKGMGKLKYDLGWINLNFYLVEKYPKEETVTKEEYEKMKYDYYEKIEALQTQYSNLIETTKQKIDKVMIVLNNIITK